MSRLFLLAFLAFTASAMLPLNEPNPSNVNLAVDYATLDTMKATLAQPLVTRFVKNISIPGNITEKIGIVDVFVNNIIIVDVDMDWPNSRILMVEKDGKPTVMLKDVIVTVQFDAKVKFGFIKESGEKNIVKATVDVTLELGFAAIDDIFFGFIAKQDIPVKHLDLDFHGGLRKVANALKKALGSSLDKKVAGIIHDKVNDANKTIVALTSKPIVVKATPPIDIHGALVNFPEILNIRWADSDRQVQTATLDIEAFKENVKYEPPAKLTVMPTYVPDFAPLQAIVSQEIFQVAVWTVFQTDLTDNVKIIISEGIVPKESPIHLITTNLTDLVPSIVEQFGADKGVYLRITKGGLYPNVEITDAKINGEVAVLVEVIVDTDSSNYPKEGLDDCGACKLAYRLNATGTASLNVFKVSPLSIGGEIYEGKLNEVEVISGDADAEKIKNGLNAIVKPLIEQVNQELKGGIDLPDIVKKYGLNDTNVRLESDHLVVGGDFTLPQETPLIYW